MNLNEFMEKNDIAIVAKANLQEKIFEIKKMIWNWNPMTYLNN